MTLADALSRSPDVEPPAKRRRLSDSTALGAERFTTLIKAMENSNLSGKNTKELEQVVHTFLANCEVDERLCLCCQSRCHGGELCGDCTEAAFQEPPAE